MTVSPEDHMDHLKKMGHAPDDEINLAHTALVLAALDRPGISFQKYEHHLEIIGLDLANHGQEAVTAVDRAASLIDVLHGNHDYRGNEEHYDDLQNANLMSVIDRRLGLPVSLSILYIHGARARGWQAEGLNFPAHFMIRIFGDGDQVIMDPFHGGRVMEAQDLRQLMKTISGGKMSLQPEHYHALENRAILIRLLNNIKTRCLQLSDFSHAINVLERMVLIDPDKIMHRYEWGLLQAHCGIAEEGRANLRTCLEMMDEQGDIDDMKRQIVSTLKEMKRSDNPNIFALISNDFKKEDP